MRFTTIHDAIQPEESEESVDPQTTKKVGVTEGGVNIRVAAIVGAVELALHTKGETVATVRMEGGRGYWRSMDINSYNSWFNSVKMASCVGILINL